jgi:hypothetical protein
MVATRRSTSTPLRLVMVAIVFLLPVMPALHGGLCERLIQLANSARLSTAFQAAVTSGPVNGTQWP